MEGELILYSVFGFCSLEKLYLADIFSVSRCCSRLEKGIWVGARGGGVLEPGGDSLGVRE